MKKTVLRIIIAAVAAIVGMGIAFVAAKPPDTVPVAVTTVPVPAGVPITQREIGTEIVPLSWAKSAVMMAPAAAIGFVPAFPLPAGTPIVAADRETLHLNDRTVALPLTVTLGTAPGIVAGDRVAIYLPGNGMQSSGLVASGVPVLQVLGAPAPASESTTSSSSSSISTSTQEIVIIKAPLREATRLVGQNCTLALMTGNPPTIWYGDGRAAFSTAPTPVTGLLSQPVSSHHPITSKTRKPQSHHA